MSEENVQIVKQTYEAFGRGDVPAVLGNFDPDVEWHAAEGLPWGGLHRGPEAVAQNVFGAVMAVIDDFTLSPERYIDSGDTVVALGRYSGTGKAGGQRLDAAFAHVWDLDGGRLKHFHHYADTARFNDAIA